MPRYDSISNFRNSSEQEEKSNPRLYKGLREELGLSETEKARAILEQKEADRLNSNTRLFKIARQRDQRRADRDKRLASEAEAALNLEIREMEAEIAELENSIENTEAKIQVLKDKISEAVSEIAKLSHIYSADKGNSFFIKKMQELRRGADESNTEVKVLNTELADLKEKMTQSIEKYEEVINNIAMKDE